MNLGTAKYTYEVIENWGTLPNTWRDWTWGWIVGIACDSQDRVYVYSRSKHPLIVFDRDGTFLTTWGDGVLAPYQAHGIFIDKDDNVYCTDAANHCVHKFNAQGEHLWTLGTPGRRAAVDGAPFNMPTDLAVASSGELFISDGYGNARVHKFSPVGELIHSWGERGTGPGQFSISHCVRLDRRDRAWVCDRENNRIQIFDSDGRYLTEWTGLLRPNTVHFDPQADVVYIAELTRRLSIYALDLENLTGELITQWGDAQPSEEPGKFRGGPHGAWTDSRGDLYLGEVELGEVGRMHKYARVHL
jgi:sugar lactone lactonase YvrE